VKLRHEILRIQIPFHAAGGSGFSRPPQALQWKLGVRVHDRRDSVVQVRFGDMSLIDKRQLKSVRSAHRTSRLDRPQIRSVAECSKHVAFARAFHLCIEPREWSKMTGPVQPMLRIDQRIKDLHLVHTLPQKLLCMSQTGGIGVGSDGAQNGFVVFNP
jgi:hypothetical protein